MSYFHVIEMFTIIPLVPFKPSFGFLMVIAIFIWLEFIFFLFFSFIFDDDIFIKLKDSF